MTSIEALRAIRARVPDALEGWDWTIAAIRAAGLLEQCNSFEDMADAMNQVANKMSTGELDERTIWDEHLPAVREELSKHQDAREAEWN